jgi:hypothetical protein
VLFDIVCGATEGAFGFAFPVDVAAEADDPEGLAESACVAAAIAWFATETAWSWSDFGTFGPWARVNNRSAVFSSATMEV